MSIVDTALTAIVCVSGAVVITAALALWNERLLRAHACEPCECEPCTLRELNALSGPVEIDLSLDPIFRELVIEQMEEQF